MLTRTIFAADERFPAFEELLSILVLFWLHARRGRRRRAREQRTTAVQNTLCGSGVAAANAGLRKFSECATPFQGTRVNRSMWVEHRSAAFFQNIVPSGSDHDLSRATFR